MPPVPPNTAHSRAVRWHFRWQGGEIAELQRMIDTSPAETLEDAAVKLRRLGAYAARRIIDVSRHAAEHLGFLGADLARVRVEAI